MYDACGAGRRGRCRCEGLSVLLSVRLPACPAAVEVARHQARGVLELHEADAAAMGDAELLTSELVTNGVVHVGRERPGTELGLSLIRDGDRLLTEVHDPSRELPHGLRPLRGDGLQGFLENFVGPAGSESPGGERCRARAHYLMPRRRSA